MRYTADDEYPFDTDNRAWRRFTDLLGEHFDVLTWTKEDGRPVLTTLSDIASGDTFTVAILDSLEMRQPHTLLAFATGCEIAAHGPFDGQSAAADYAPQLAMTDPRVAATRPTPLHHPDQTTLPDDTWIGIPADLARAAHPALTDAAAAVLVLLDHTRALLAAIGPFTSHDAAGAWQPTPGLDPGIDRLVVPLHPAAPIPHAS
jgi:hypothetical protein